MIVLSKESSPGWTMMFHTKQDVVTELRKHLCRECLAECDALHDDYVYTCRDLSTLLSTSCGSEFWVDEEPLTIDELMDID